MSIKTISQERAAWALKGIEDVETSFTQSKDRGEYSTLVRGLPAMLEANGLGAALAFLSSKAKGSKQTESTHACLFHQLSDWLNIKFRTPPFTDEFLNWLMKQDSSTYRQASAEAMQLSIWLRRFAEAKNWGEKPREAQHATE